MIKDERLSSFVLLHRKVDELSKKHQQLKEEFQATVRN